jgi:hypothetical protein
MHVSVGSGGRGISMYALVRTRTRTEADRAGVASTGRDSAPRMSSSSPLAPPSKPSSRAPKSKACPGEFGRGEARGPGAGDTASRGGAGAGAGASSSAENSSMSHSAPWVFVAGGGAGERDGARAGAGAGLRLGAGVPEEKASPRTQSSSCATTGATGERERGTEFNEGDAPPIRSPPRKSPPVALRTGAAAGASVPPSPPSESSPAHASEPRTPPAPAPADAPRASFWACAARCAIVMLPVAAEPPPGNVPPRRLLNASPPPPPAAPLTLEPARDIPGSGMPPVGVRAAGAGEARADVAGGEKVPEDASIEKASYVGLRALLEDPFVGAGAVPSVRAGAAGLDGAEEDQRSANESDMAGRGGQERDEGEVYTSSLPLNGG